jgi:hypothetical protein
MKNLTYTMFALLLSVFVIGGCNKVGNPVAVNGQLVASKTNVKIHELDSLVLVGANVTDSISWSVVPAGFNTLIKNHNKALVSFSKAGSYTVTASRTGKAPASAVINVADSVYNPSDSSHVIPLKGDKITLLSGLYKSKLGDTSYIYFVAQSTKFYCPSSIINFTNSLDASNNFSLNLINVKQSGTCAGPMTTIASQVIAFKQSKQNPYMVNGSYPLKVTLNDTTYTGNIVVSAASVNFNWNYTKGVLITPKQIAR